MGDIDGVVLGSRMNKIPDDGLMQCDMNVFIFVTVPEIKRAKVVMATRCELFPEQPTPDSTAAHSCGLSKSPTHTSDKGWFQWSREIMMNSENVTRLRTGHQKSKGRIVLS